MKKILYVIAQKGFRDEEFFTPYEMFKEKGIDVDVMSIRRETAHGSISRTFEPNLGFGRINSIDPNEYSCIIIAGGPGALELATYDEFIGLLNKFYSADLHICAICIAPRILTKTDFAKDKTMTVWNGDSKQSAILESAGIKYKDAPVVVDGKIITANGPDAASEFAETILEHIF